MCIIHRNSIILISVVIFLCINASANERVLIRLDEPDKQTVEKFINGNYDVASYHPEKYLDLVIELSQYQLMLKKYPEIKILQTEEQIKANLNKGKDIDGYRNYEQTLAELQQIAQDNPDICKLYNIGKSRGKEYSETGISFYDDFNHDIWALKLSDNVEIEEDEPSFFFLGSHHAREPVSTEVVMELLNNMIDNYDSDTDMQNRINNSQIWFVPIVNPDGKKIVLTEQDIWWRKNICDNDLSLNFTDSIDGVDPNRNYGFWWGALGRSDEPFTDGYIGEEEFSEPEIKAVKNLIDSHHFVAGITYHSTGEMVLYPFGYEYTAIPPDINSISTLADRMAASIPSETFGTYESFQCVGLYPTRGTTDDYAYGEHGIFCYTIETATEFIPPYSDALNVCHNNLDAAYILLDRVNSSALTGIITDQVTKSFVVAEAYVEGIDNLGIFKEAYKSDEEFGRYYRILEPGEYNITFSAYGYIPVTIPNVTISSSEITNLDISLTPAAFRDISGYIAEDITGLPIKNAEIEINEYTSAATNDDGYFTLINIPYGNNSFEVSSPNFITQNTEIIIDETTAELNFNLSQGNFEDFEDHNFSTFNLSYDESYFDWYISSYMPRFGEFYARSAWIFETGWPSTLILRDSIAENGNISFALEISIISVGDTFEFIIDEEVIKVWNSVVRWTTVSFPVTTGFHTFTWEFNKNTSSDLDVHASIDNITFPRIIETGIENSDELLVKNCDLKQNFPNPFNPTTTIEFIINKSENVKLNIFNIKGELVANIIDKILDQGSHRVIFDGRNLNSGLYFVSLEAGDFKQINSMLLLK